MRCVLVVCLLTTMCVSGCSKGGSDSGSPTGPTTPTPAPANPGTVVSQNGCSVTYACPNVDSNGVANPSTPTFDRLTVSNGTSSSCKVDSYRNTQPDPGQNIAIEFTLRNTRPTTPSESYNWGGTGGASAGTGGTDCAMHLNSPMNGRADTTGPFQALVGFGGCSSAQRSGDTFTQTLTIEIRRPTGDPNNQPLVAACGVTLWGYVTPNK